VTAHPVSLVVFDAMGVLYRWGDDVGQVLIPYLRRLGCRLDRVTIEQWYDDASLGRMTSAELWAFFGVVADNDAYCAGYDLTPGIPELLADLRRQGVALACLSNDLAEWSRVLRHQFGLDHLIDHWVISGDIGCRKPDAAAYDRLIDSTGVAPSAVFFLDDKPENVVAARQAGWQAAIFTGVDSARQQSRQRGLLPDQPGAPR